MILNFMKFAREGMAEHEVAAEAVRFAEATNNPLSFPLICTTQGQIISPVAMQDSM